MSTHSAGEVIDHIIQITGHSDRERMHSSLVTTLHELLNVQSISLSQIVFHYGEPELHLFMEINPDGVYRDGMLAAQEERHLSSLPGYHNCFTTKSSTASGDGDQRLYIFPLLNGDHEVTGFIELYGAVLGEADHTFMKGLLRIYRNFIRILDESERDTLTGLLNRRTFDKNIHRLLQAVDRGGDAMDISNPRKPKRRFRGQGQRNWLAVIDIDHFKDINDHYGHLYGDEVLLLLANIMRSSFRGYDKLFRFGGEEFVVVLKSLSEEDAIQTLERFRKTVEEHRFPQVIRVTVSIGFIEIQSDDIPSRVLGMADEALYYAKDHGRNQICFYTELVESGAIREPRISDDIELF